MIYKKKYADTLKDKAGQSWRPENNLEGSMFVGEFCEHCVKCSDDGRYVTCSILFHSAAFDIDHEKSPEELIYSTEGQPVCTAFELKKEKVSA